MELNIQLIISLKVKLHIYLFLYLLLPISSSHVITRHIEFLFQRSIPQVCSGTYFVYSHIMLFSTASILATAVALASAVNGNEVFLLAGDSTTHEPAGKFLFFLEVRIKWEHVMI
jgi:hypothetical protein